MKRGMFISLEGGELCGKTTQRDKMATYFADMGYEVVLTREPGGTPMAEEIREIVKRTRDEPVSSMAELLLMYASRAQHIERVIKPAIKRGAVIICDRFHDSSLVYQHYARGLPLKDLQTLSKMVVGDCIPDITYVFLADPEVVAVRRQGRTPDDRLDNETLSFHKRVNKGYKALLNDNSVKGRGRRNMVGIDAEKSVDEVFGQIEYHLNIMVELFSKLGSMRR